MAGLNQWWTDSNAVPPVPPPATATLTAVQTLTIGGWMPPTTPNTPTVSLTNIAGSMVNPYKWTLPWNPLITGHGPQTPPMGPFGPGAGGMGAPLVSTKTLPAGTHNVAYSYQLTAAGGVGPYTFAVTTGTLPTGVTLSSAGLLSGTATAAGTTNISVTVTDSKTNVSAPQALTLVMA
jgi:hypothetical protein